MSEKAGPELDAKLAEALGWEWWRSSETGRRALYRPGQQPSWMLERADGSEEICRDVVGTAGMVPWVPFSAHLGEVRDAAEALRIAGRISGWSVYSRNYLDKDSPCEATVELPLLPDGTRWGDESQGESEAHALTLALLLALDRCR